MGRPGTAEDSCGPAFQIVLKDLSTPRCTGVLYRVRLALPTQVS